MYVAPRESAKVQARKAAAYGHAPKKAPKKAQGAAAMAKIAKAGK